MSRAAVVAPSIFTAAALARSSGALALWALVGCAEPAATAPETPRPIASSSSAASVASAAPEDARDKIAKLPGKRFERRDPFRAQLPHHELSIDHLFLEASGEKLISISIRLAPGGSYPHTAYLDARIVLVDEAGATSPAPVQSVEESPHNGGGVEHPDKGAYRLARMQPAVLDEVVISFNPPLARPTRALRVTIDDQTVDVPLRFGPPTPKEVPEVPPDVEAACAKLERCCAAQTTAENARACTDLAAAARRLGLAAECTKAANAYCR
jgi:hypothetical protein